MTSDSNKRASDRLNERGTIFIEMVSSSDPANGQGRIVICNSRDISTSGLCVCVDDAIELGSILQLGVEITEISHTMYLVGQVMHCTAIDGEQGRFEVGFELIDSSGTDIEDWRALVRETE